MKNMLMAALLFWAPFGHAQGNCLTQVLAPYESVLLKFSRGQLNGEAQVNQVLNAARTEALLIKRQCNDISVAKACIGLPINNFVMGIHKLGKRSQTDASLSSVVIRSNAATQLRETLAMEIMVKCN